MNKDVLNSAIEAIQGLLKLVPMCEHEDTHRGGAIWEICDSCGAEWADDEGGRPEYREPVEITAALDAINVLKDFRDSGDVIAGKDVVNRAARRAARMIWEDCLDRNSLKFVLRDTSSTTKYKEILPAWVDIIKREILGE